MNKIEQLKELKALLDSDVINQKEFDQMKAEIIGVFENLPISEIKKIKNNQSDKETISFKTTKIGNQIWMAENLNVSLFRSGDVITEAKTIDEWNTAREKMKPAWCYHEDNINNEKNYGKLYNWYAVDDKRGIAPIGWHIPSQDEADKMIWEHDGKNGPAENMKSITGWVNDDDGNDGNGKNKFGFNAQAGGYRNSDGEFCIYGESTLGNSTGFWVSTEGDPEFMEDCGICYDLYNHHGNVNLGEIHKSSGFYIRCIKNEIEKDENAQVNAKSEKKNLIKKYEDIDIDILEDADEIENNKNIVGKFINNIYEIKGRQALSDILIQNIEEEEDNDYTNELIKMLQLINDIYSSNYLSEEDNEGKKVYPYALNYNKVKDFINDKNNSLGDRMSKVIDVTDNFIDRLEKNKI